MLLLLAFPEVSAGLSTGSGEDEAPAGEACISLSRAGVQGAPAAGTSLSRLTVSRAGEADGEGSKQAARGGGKWEELDWSSEKHFEVVYVWDKRK